MKEIVNLDWFMQISLHKSSNHPSFKIAHNKDNKCLSEERLTMLIREIFREEFEKQQKNLLNLISGNLEITMKEIQFTKTEMNDLTKSIEFNENMQEEKVQKCQEKAEHLDE